MQYKILFAVIIIANVSAANANQYADISVDSNRDGDLNRFHSQPIDIAFSESQSKLPGSSVLSGVKNAVAQSGHGSRERDRISKTNPFIFWANDDLDLVVREGDPRYDEKYCEITSNGNYASDRKCDEVDFNNAFPQQNGYIDESNTSSVQRLDEIESLRDLEDFVPVHFTVNPYDSEKTVLSLRANGINVNFFQSLSDNQNAREHVEDLDFAIRQTNLDNLLQVRKYRNFFEKNLHLHDETEEVVINPEIILNTGGSNYQVKLLMEGVEPSPEYCRNEPDQCYLELIISEKSESSNIARRLGSQKLFMRIEPIKELFEHTTVGDLVSTRDAITTPPFVPIQSAVDQPFRYSDRSRGLSIPEFEHQYILFVHGWRMEPWERRVFAETAFKRLYWQGYKGRFGLFSWPTGWFYKPGHEDTAVQAIRALPHTQNYDRSDAIARHAGKFLYNYLGQLKDLYPRLNLIAHSMGNVVVSEALLRSVQSSGDFDLIDTYIASQAATAADSYTSILDVRMPDNSEYQYNGGVRNWFTLNDSPETRLFFEGVQITPPSGWNSLQERIPLKHGEIPNYLNFSDLDVSDHPLSPELSNRLPNPRYAQIGLAVSGNIYNYLNPNDFALEGWELNAMTKPDSGDLSFSLPSWEYARDIYFDNLSDSSVEDFSTYRTSSKFILDFSTSLPSQISMGDNTYGASVLEILAYIVPPRGKSLGASFLLSSADGINANVFSEECNLDRLGFTENSYDHSAQFLGNAAMRKGYWRQVVSTRRGFEIIEESGTEQC